MRTQSALKARLGAVNGTSLIKRKRRTRAAIGTIKDAMFDLLEQEHPLTIRHVFYRMVSAGVVDKTEAQYKGTVCRLLADMRKEGRLPYDWLTDNTRWFLKPTTYRTLGDALDTMQDNYRRSLWAAQDVHVEVWTEKDAIAGILSEVTSEWDVPLMIARGYASLSFLYSVAEDLKRYEKPAFLYYFGDHDPSGRGAMLHVEEKIREMAPDVDVTFQCVAVTPEQIEEYDLPTRPTKKSDTRARSFKGDSVEVDAIKPAILRQLVRDCIEQHVDHDTLDRTKWIERAERNTLSMILNRFNDEQEAQP